MNLRTIGPILVITTSLLATTPFAFGQSSIPVIPIPEERDIPGVHLCNEIGPVPADPGNTRIQVCVKAATCEPEPCLIPPKFVNELDISIFRD